MVGWIVSDSISGKTITKIEARRDAALNAKEEQIKAITLDLYRAQQERDYHQAIKVNLELKADSISKALAESQTEAKKIKNSLKKLTNDQLVTEANKEYGGLDTTKLEILLSRPTTEYLVESAKKVKSCRDQLNLALALNGNYVAQLNQDKQMFNSYDSSILGYESIIKYKDEEIKISIESLDKYKKKIKRERVLTKILIGAAAAGVLYGVTK